MIGFTCVFTAVIVFNVCWFSLVFCKVFAEKQKKGFGVFWGLAIYFPFPRNIFLFLGIFSFYEDDSPFMRNIFLFPGISSFSLEYLLFPRNIFIFPRFFLVSQEHFPFPRNIFLFLTIFSCFPRTFSFSQQYLPFPRNIFFIPGIFKFSLKNDDFGAPAGQAQVSMIFN